MTQLWPRISPLLAKTLFAVAGTRDVEQLVTDAATDHLQATYAATGGLRVRPEDVGALATDIRDIASAFGYPTPTSDSERVAFDRAAAEVVYARMRTSTVEAANRGVWNFLAGVAMPDVTLWRFGHGNIERWVASDLTRHMFARLWWQALTFAVPTEGGVDLSLLRVLSEGDLNQITERRAIGGNPRLAQALVRVATTAPTDLGRRELLRDITPRLRRQLAFIDFSVLSNDQIDDHLRVLIQLSRGGARRSRAVLRPANRVSR